MDNSRKKNPLNRRGFLKSAAVGTAALVAKGPEVKAQQTQPARGGAPLPSASAVAAETEPVSNVEVLTADHPGSDFMLDVIKSLGFEYIANVNRIVDITVRDRRCMTNAANAKQPAKTSFSPDAHAIGST